MEENKIYDPNKHKLIRFWQCKGVNKNIIHHKTITKLFIKVERERLSEYSLDELKEAISNYDTVLGHPKVYWYSYKHSFTEFFRPGVRKDPPFMRFLNEAEPLKNLMRNKGNINQNYQSDENEPNELAI